MKKLLLFLCFLTPIVASNKVQAANYYWVGGSTTVWGATSGAWKINGFSGTPVNTIPGSSDNVFIGNGTSNSTVTLDANYTIDSLTILGSGMIFINTSTAKTLSVTGAIYVSNTSTIGGGSATLIISGAGKQTLTNISTVSNKGKLPNITVNKTDTLHLVGYITMGGSTTLKLTAGTIDPGTSTLSFYLSNTITGVINVYDAEFQGTSSTCSITDTLRVNHNLNFTGSGYLVLNGNDIKVKGNVAMSNSSTNGSGGATVEFIGSSNQTLSSSVPEGEGFLPNIKISKSADSLKLSGILSIRGNWTNNYSTSLIEYGTAELFCPGYNALSGMSFNGSKSTPFYDVNFNAPSGFSPVFTLGKDSALIVKDSLKLTTGGAGMTISGHSILIEGSVINHVSNLAANTSLFIIGGGNSQLMRSTVSEGSGYFPSILIQKSGGVVTLKGTISEGANWTNNSDTSYINTDTSTVYIGHCCSDGTQTIGGTAPTPFYNLTLGGASNCIFALGRDSAAIVKNNLKLKNNNQNVIINNYHMVVRGNIAVTNTSTSSGGTTEIILAGGANQIITSTSSRGLGYLPSIRLQKTAGTLSLTGIVSIKGNWTNNYSATNIGYTAGELYFYGGGTQSLGGTYQTPVYRLTFGGSSVNTYSLGIDSAFIVKDTFKLQGTNTVTINNYSLNLEGPIVMNASTANVTGTTIINIRGANNQVLTGANGLTLQKVVMNKQAGTFTLNKPLTVTTSLTLTKGNIVSSSTNLLTLNNGATVTGTSNNSFVSGPVKKIGAAAFKFPVGSGTTYKPISISAPTTATDAYTAQYYNTGLTNSLDGVLTYADPCEYWNLTHTTGSSTVHDTLFWNSPCFYIANLSYFKIGYVSGSTLTSAGTCTTTGNTTTGSIASVALGNLTLAKTNPLVTAHAGRDTTFCGTATVTLGTSPTVTGGTSPFTYSWSPATGLSSSTVANPTATPTVTTTYVLTVTDNLTEFGKDTVVVRVSKPVAHAGRDTAIYTGLSVRIGNNASGGISPYVYEWSPGITLSNSDSARTTASPLATTSYFLTVTDAAACIAKDTVTVTINPIPADILERIAGSAYIFEGSVVNSTSYWNHDHNYIYTANTIEISQVLKGDIDCGTVEMITLGGAVDTTSVDVSHALHLRQGNAGVFLCNTTTREAPATPFYYESNSMVLEPPFEENSFVKYWWDGLETQASDQTHVYGTVDNVYALSSEVTGYSWTKCEETAYLKKRSHPKDTTRTVPAIQQAYNKNHPRLRNGPEIDYSMLGTETYGANSQFVELNVYASSAYGNYLGGGVIHLRYDTAEYGANAATNAIINPGSMIAEAVDEGNYIYYVYDDGYDGYNEITIRYLANDPIDTASIGLSAISNSPQLLFNLIIPIIDCNNTGAISFADTADMLNVAFYSPTRYDDTSINYEALTVSPGVSFTSCNQLEITRFSPTTINGGVGQVLTVRGHKFGAKTGNANLYFKNADDGGNSEVALNSEDYLLWSDTLIQAIIPSTNDTIDGAPIQDSQNPIGSGNIRVVTDTSGAYRTLQSLTVFYSVMDVVTGGYGKQYSVLTGPNSNGGYLFYVDTAIWNHQDRLTCVKTALRRWSCLTGVNWKVDSFVVGAQDTALHDGRNVIKFGGAGKSSNGTVLINTHPYINPNCNIGVCDEIDMVINSSVTWICDTTGTVSIPNGDEDFFGNLLHELGHGHLLNHVNDPSAIMYYATTGVRKLGLEGDGSCLEGGNEVMYLSTHTGVITCTGSSVPEVITPHYICEEYNGVQPVLNQNGIVVYPNPADNTVNVDFKIDNESKTEFGLINMYGQCLLSVHPTNIHDGKNTVTLNLKNIPPGLYVLCGEINGRLFESKIVHLNDF